jgi:thiamine-phosphate diphosphorylase
LAAPIAIPIPILHAVTSDEIAARAGFVQRASAVMRALGPRGAVHLRAQRLSASQVHALATELVRVQSASGCWLVINDRIDLALATGARGVQLTSRSMGVGDARSIAPRLPLGASVHGVDQAMAAEREGASWAVVGQRSAVEEGRAPEPGQGEALVRAVSGSTIMPIIAIGGIQPQHVGGLRLAGAWGIAVIRGIWATPDAEAAATDYLSQYDAAGA